MTIDYLRLLLLDVVLLATGLALLHGLGLVWDARTAVRNAGLALFAAWALVGVLETFVLEAGGPITITVVALLCAAVAAAGSASSRRVRTRGLHLVDEVGAGSWIAVGGAAVLLVELTALLRRSLAADAPLQWDAWSFWLPKAKSIVAFGGLDTGMGGFTSFANVGYPPFVPASEATSWAFMANTHAAPLAFQHWIIALAFFGAVASLLLHRVRPALVFPALALLSVLPTFDALIGSSLGDEPLMLLSGAGGVCAALWLLERDPRFAALAGVFLAAAAVAKVEGLDIAIVIGLVTLLAVRRWPSLALLGAPAVAIIPWKLWLRGHHIVVSPDYRIRDLFHGHLFGDRLHRLWYALHHLPTHYVGTSRWLVAVPLAFVAIALAARRRPALSVLALAPLVLFPLGLLVVYWIGYPAVDWYVSTTADRALASAVVTGVVLVPLLLGEAVAPEAPSG